MAYWCARWRRAYHWKRLTQLHYIRTMQVSCQWSVISRRWCTCDRTFVKLHNFHVATNHWHAHQSPLAPCAAANYIQGSDADVPCTARLCITLLGVIIHVCSLTWRTDRGLGPPPLNVLTLQPAVGQHSEVVLFLLLVQRCGTACHAMWLSASLLAVFKNRLKTYLFHCCYETVWLCFLFPVKRPLQYSGPCNSFNCLGHFKNVWSQWWWWW